MHMTDGPARDELVGRMLSSLPVTFPTDEGSYDVLIEEIEETVPWDTRVSFVGKITTGILSTAP